MKAKPQKTAKPGKVGGAAGKSGKGSPKSPGTIKGMDKDRYGSATGVLSKHFK